MNIEQIQTEIRQQNVDGWLFYDFHNRDKMAYHILGLNPNMFVTRRWYYFIPAEGIPIKLVSAVEATKIDNLPGEKIIYRSWEQQHSSLRTMLKNSRRIAMQYSPNNNIPYISVVDGGTIELIRSFGVEIVSSANLVQIFEAVIDEEGYQSHLRAGQKVQQIKNEAFALISSRIKEQKSVTEFEVQQFIVKRFGEEDLTDDNEHPIVGVNEHPADPHFEPKAENAYTIKTGDKVLIDLWAREQSERAIYYDITWCGFVGQNPPAKYVEIFNIVVRARNAARDFIRRKMADNQPCYGYQVDDACRNVVKEAGYGDYFVHRTGHSIGHYVHGNGVNIDNLETKDERELVPGICFSIEPGIYLPGEMAVRSEINVFITKDREVVVAGDEQEKLLLL